jgi:hypothetical protein
MREEGKPKEGRSRVKVTRKIIWRHSQGKAMTLTHIDLAHVDTALTKLREACELLSAASPRNARKVHAAVKCVERAQLRIIQRLEVVNQQRAA